MSDSEDEDYDSNEEEDEEDEEEEENGGTEGEDVQAARKKALVQGDIATLLDIFSYIDRTSKRIASRLVNEGAKAKKIQPRSIAPSKSKQKNIANEAAGGGKTTFKGGKLEDPDDESVVDEPSLTGGWSQYEHMGDVERGMLLEKALLALSIPEKPERQSKDGA